MNCTRCDGTGFLNRDQLPDELFTGGVEQVQRWIADHLDSDVSVCDCCGDGDSAWYGEPGQHYTSQDPIGKNGPYAYNGGLCECH
jgi:hypothetical protein